MTIYRGAFRPDHVNNLVLWVDGEDESTITKDGANKVSQWDDKSGIANHLIQGISSEQPLYVASGINSKGILRFDGIDDFLFHSNFQIGSHLTVFIVSHASSPYFLIEQSVNINAYDGFMFYGFGAPPAWVRNNDIHLTAPSNFHWAGTAPMIGHMKYDGNLLSYYKNNILKGSIVGSIPNNTVTDILRINKHATSLIIAGDIGEIIIYNRGISIQESNSVYNYLYHKWLS